ncbi:nitrilase-related carbon-nitrogen hydrolase [Haladaptatus salinisoli]|uniref:nitrilase-related carbon-nitrogen hydrolase n=1 Tax=Haladaptatus salinisoli TaxID=2884876 RepID=UPI001D0A0F0E|nr:nitrilase-related carbon-nitrogen hydrolase [Haladaptatus salinisoli]
MDGGETFVIALCQYELRGVESLDGLLRRVEASFDRAGDADLYVLPELFANDRLEEAGDADATGIDPGERARLHEFLSSAANERDAVVVGGSYDATDEGSTYNRCPIAVPGSSVRTYDKLHPTPEERRRGKRPGDGPAPVVEHEGVGIGVAVCYDVEFPNLVRGLADRGAEVVAVPSWTADEAGYQRVRRCSAARAVENQLYVAQVSVVGNRPGGDLTGTGRSAVFAPCDDVVGAHGTRLSLPRDESAAATYSVDVTALRKSRTDAAVRPYADANRRED